MKEKLTCYIIDDEPLAQEILEEYISKVSFLELKGSFASPLEAVGSLKEDTLTFSVQNPVGKNSTPILDEPGGIGLPNVRKRLALLYPDHHTLEIHNLGETFAVVLEIHSLQLQPHERKTHLLYH